MLLTNEDLLAISQIFDERLDIRLKSIEMDIKELKEDIAVLKQKVGSLEQNYETMNTRLQNIELFQENIILPRLNTIESCYTDTYRRYQKDSEKMEMLFDDVDLLKKTAISHSEKLQKLA